MHIAHGHGHGLVMAAAGKAAEVIVMVSQALIVNTLEQEPVELGQMPVNVFGQALLVL